MPGYLALVLHAHLPFVRHPEHERFLEESWLFEAITESYLPLLQVLEGWRRDGLGARLALTLTPTLCSMFQDQLLRERYLAHLDGLIELADKEAHRTLWEKPLHKLALFYYERFNTLREFYLGLDADVVGRFRRLQELGRIEIITSSATHAVLPLLESHPESIRAQILVARDHYRSCFGCEPLGLWLPECAYSEAVEPALVESGIRWFILESHGLLLARPKPRFAFFAPVVTPHGLAAFGRDRESARQVWSREGGYPGDPRYRDFYRDIGFDLDLDYVRPHLAAADHRGFTGVKYYRITAQGHAPEIYDRPAALQAAEEHAAHFLKARVGQAQRLERILGQPAIIVAPYDAELFGHWWYEGPEFLDLLVRLACADQTALNLITPTDYLRRQATHQVARPSPSSWGEAGYWGVWLNEKNQWIYPHLRVAQERMSELARRFERPTALQARVLAQAARELLLAQASDWPFILYTGTSPGYARQRVSEHLVQFTGLYGQLMADQIEEGRLGELEAKNNVFPEVDYRYWSFRGTPAATFRIP
jgi:1,4-alpha-glucan branching enzyme